jgi:hypothetical protein
MEEMRTTLENINKVVANFIRSVVKKKNVVEKVGVLGLRMKREQENTYVKAHKMMKGRMEPFVVPIVVKAVPTMVQTTR